MQHLGLEVAFSTAFRSTEEGIWGGTRGNQLLLAALQQGDMWPGGVPGVNCWGSQCHMEEAARPNPIPTGARSRSQLPAAWESWPLPAPAALPQPSQHYL